MFAVVEAVKAEDTFAYSYIAGGFAAAFARPLAQSAIYTFASFFADAPDCEPVDYAEQGAEGTYEPAIETGDEQIKQHGCCEYRENERSAFVESCLGGNDIGKPVGYREQYQIERAGCQRYGVEQA